MSKCPECGSEKVVKAGWTWRARKRIQQYRCNSCGHYFIPKKEA